MTISYDEEFSSLMLRWRGSIWKAVLKDLIGFYIAYYIVLAFQWYLLDEKGKEYFTGWIMWCEIGAQYIPLSFLLGFFVSLIVARWWEQFNCISWPDKMMIMVSACLPGNENLVVRQTIARWSSLQAAIAWSGVSVKTLKRFPTERHMVASKLMTEEEYDLYMNTEAPHGKWFIPILWIVNLIKKQKQKGVIDSIQMDMLLKQVYSYRDGFAMLFVYDWIKIPLVYTQVVAIATYGYFFICLIGRQPKLDQRKLNYVLDRNTAIAHMMASELSDQLPSIGAPMVPAVPHTRASFKIQDVIPKSHLAGFKLSDAEMKLIKPEDLEEHERLLEETKVTNRQRLGTLVRAIEKKSRTNATINEDDEE
ncbi:Protein CBG09639 [Caenorhabditis briggsae]|uniref:Bestrophin homolog n=1 Tax=Caenorhabditis briggsae TaxID=6238 RepID=A8X8L1_CAEBR|nr:Protein CBG09639 [Caenorhabditis briggsae]CAP28972.2 Protein CBG09639 [Caenorhabditis briggsae]